MSPSSALSTDAIFRRYALSVARARRELRVPVSRRMGVGLLVAVFGLFIGGVLLGLHGGTPIRFVGLPVLGAGFLAALFSPAIAGAQKDMAEKPDNDAASNLHVERSGTQYTICGVAAEGIDRTRLRYKRCGAGAYVLEFKKLHALP